MEPVESGAPAPDAGPVEVRARRAELGVFLLLIAPALLSSFVPAAGATPGFPVFAAAVVARDLSLVVLVAFFLWRGGEPLGQLGWRRAGAGREIGLGILLFVPVEAAVGALQQLLRGAGLSFPTGPPPQLQPTGPAQIALGVLLVLVVAFAEETLFRGYLLLRLRTFTRSPAAMVVGSSAVFAVGHGYEHAGGVVTVGVLGALLALVYLWRGSLVAAITLHFLVDLASVVLPALARH